VNHFIAGAVSLRLKSEQASIDLPMKAERRRWILTTTREEATMLLEIAYAEEKVRDLHRAHAQTPSGRYTRPDPKAEAPRTGVGLVHEVFRKIAESERPARQPAQRRWRSVFG
jgi:hypothetical protein